MDYLLTVNKIADLTGWDRRAVGRRLAALPPAEVRGRARLYELGAVLRFLARPAAGEDGTPPLDPAQERAALDRARRELVELDAAQRRGELVTVDDFSAALVLVSTNARDRLLALPSRLASTCADLPSPELFTEAQRLVFECLDAIRADVLVAGEKYDWSTPRWTARTGGDAVPTTPGAPSAAADTTGGRRKRSRVPARPEPARRGALPKEPAP